MGEVVLMTIFAKNSIRVVFKQRKSPWFFWGFGKFPTNHFWDQPWNEDPVIKQLGFNGEFHGSHYWELLESLPFSPGTFVRQVVLLSHLWISAFWSGWIPMDGAQRNNELTIFFTAGRHNKNNGEGKKGKWWEVCFVKVCKITTLGKMLGLIWFLFFGRWLLWTKVRIMFQRFRCGPPKKLTCLLTSIAQCTPFGMHHFRFKIDLGYTWLHHPKPNTSPKKRDLEYRTSSNHWFSLFFSKHVPFQRSKSIFEAFLPFRPIFVDSCLISPSNRGYGMVVSSRFTHQLQGLKPGWK